MVGRTVAEVVAVEHDPIRAELVATRAPANLRVLARAMGAPAAEPGGSEVAAFLAAHPNPPLSGDEARDVADGLVWAPFAAYLAELARYPAGWFDVVVVDGMARAPAAAMAAPSPPTAGGVLDNADRWQYNAGYDALAAAGFARLNSTAPGRCWSTSPAQAIFTRSLNWARVTPAITRGRPSDLRW